MRFEKTIYEDRYIRLVVNYTWISDDIARTEELQLNLFAFDKYNYKEIFNQTLGVSEMRILYSHLNQISILKDDTISESWNFIELSNEALINFFSKTKSIDDSVISAVFEKISADNILKSLSLLDLENLVAWHKQQKYKLELSKLGLILHLEDKWTLLDVISKHPLIKKYSAKQPEKVLQNWLENNLWVFWVEYEKIEWFRKINENSEWDLIMKSIDGYLDLIELKKSKYDLLTFDRSHNCYHWRKELNSVIWQCMHYLRWTQEISKKLQEEQDIKILRPRIKIIAWRSNWFNVQQFDTLRMINSHLIDITIITYDELINFWNKIISHYS